MSSSTNIALNSRSMNGIISISDGSAILENGQLVCSNVSANNISTSNFTTSSITCSGIFKSNTNGSYTIPTLTDNTVGSLISYSNTLNGGETDITNYQGANTGTGGFKLYNKSSTQTLTNLAIIDNAQTYFSSTLTGCNCETKANGTNTTALASCQFCYNNFCDNTSTQTIGGLKTFSNSIITDTITTTNRIITSYVYTPTNNQIFYNMFSIIPTTTPTTSLMGGYSTQYNNSTSGSGVLSFMSYGGGGTSNTGGFEFSYLNSIVSKALLATFYPTQITFSQPLTISGTIITNLLALNANPVTTDNNMNIATTSFVKAQGYLTSSTASSTYCDLSTAQVVNGSKTFTSKTIFQDITQPTNFTYMSGQIYSEGVYLNINAKKNNVLTSSPSIIRFYVSPRDTIADNLAFTIQGSWAGSDPTLTQIIIGGALYSPVNYLGAINISGGTVLTANYNSTSTATGALTIQNGGLGVGLDIFCGGKLSIIGTTSLTGQLTISNSSISGLSQLSALTYLPAFPDISPKIASTAFVSTNFCDLSTAQTINGTKTFTDFNVNTINLTYTTTPIYLQQQIGYTIYANGINNTTIPTTLTDATGTSITITAGTWILEYNITIVPNTSLNYKIFVSGLSYSATTFTNTSGTGNSYFHNKASLTGQTITSAYTVNYSQIFYNSSGSKTIYLLALSSLNAGAGYYFNSFSLYGIYALPSSYIQATRIA
jgi:hypothetical protein